MVFEVLKPMSALACALVLATGAHAQETQPARYRLHASDVVELNFPLTPEFTQTVTVQPDGRINLRGMGDLFVLNATTPEVAGLVRNAYARIMRDPVITVELKQFEKPYFMVGGEVAKPGKYDLQGDTTVIQAVTVAGGFSRKSKKSEVLVLRRQPEGWLIVKKLDLKKAAQPQDLNKDVYLQSGDLVLIPETRIGDISRFIPVPTLGMYFNPLVP